MNFRIELQDEQGAFIYSWKIALDRTADFNLTVDWDRRQLLDEVIEEMREQNKIELAQSANE